MKIIIYISLSFLFISCEEINQNKNYKSIYDFNSNQITGNNEPVRISITEKGVNYSSRMRRKRVPCRLSQLFI